MYLTEKNVKQDAGLSTLPPGLSRGDTIQVINPFKMSEERF